MRVFYVMVLVLVAGAVPSHGRTESEGTVFNKTQPHESMNNATVSSSMLETIGYFYLAMQWPRSFCNAKYHIPCYQQPPNRFTVHGLWPQYDPSTTLLGHIDCTIERIYRNYRLFDSSQLSQSLVSRLNIHWPDLTTSESNNQCFWGTEYNKHGSCTFHNQNDYFELTLGLVADLGGLNEILRIRGGLRTGNSYWAEDIRDAVYKVTHKKPILKCITVDGITQLLELRFCVDRNRNLMNDCGDILGCGNRRGVYLP